jgi:hypothetical protein
MNYSPEVLAAAGLLDKDRPGWHRSIDLTSFNLESCTACVIGQVYGVSNVNYDLQYQAFTDRTVDLCGNDYKAAEAFYAAPKDRERHNFEWRSLVAERQAADDIELPSEAVEGYEKVLVA